MNFINFHFISFYFFILKIFVIILWDEYRKNTATIACLEIENGVIAIEHVAFEKSVILILKDIFQ